MSAGSGGLDSWWARKKCAHIDSVSPRSAVALTCRGTSKNRVTEVYRARPEAGHLSWPHGSCISSAEELAPRRAARSGRCLWDAGQRRLVVVGFLLPEGARDSANVPGSSAALPADYGQRFIVLFLSC